MKINYDKSVDALYIELGRGKVSKTIEKKDGLLVDLDKKGGILGIEVLDYSKIASRKEKLQIHAGQRKIAIPA